MYNKGRRGGAVKISRNLNTGGPALFSKRATLENTLPAQARGTGSEHSFLAGDSPPWDLSEVISKFVWRAGDFCEENERERGHFRD